MAKEELPEHAYLQSARVKGFRTLKDSEVTFVSGLNIIIGANGVGKSNLIASVKNILGTFNPSYNIGQIDAVLLCKTDSFRLLLTTEYSLETTSDIAGYQSLSNSDGNKSVIFLYKNEIEIYKNEIALTHWNEEFQKVMLQEIGLEIITSVIFNVPTNPSFTSENPVALSFSLVNNEVYRRKSLDKPKDYVFLDRFFFEIPIWFSKGGFTDEEDRNILIERLRCSDLLLENFKKYSPVSDFRLSPKYTFSRHDSGVELSNLYFEFYVDGDWLQWSNLSDGTKRLFYLINEVVRAERIVLIEEPELGVHPHQFHSIMLFLKEQAQYKQIILTTHSPYALNVLKKDDLDSIIIAKLDKDKGSVFKHLNEEQKAKALRYMTDVDYLSSYWMHSDLEDDEED